ncbi:MAG: hypothetical protein H6582_03630 [Crocinitomicaceae bacterium]|nr:hypothetical protein [Crocinitomicaceae bacterium]
MDSIRNEQQQTLKLKFKKRTDEFVDPNTPTEFLILFKNIHEIESKDHDSDYAEEYLVQDGTTIDMIGFSNSTIPIDSVLDKHESDGLSCLSFITVTGKVLRICADSAEVVVEN